MKIIQTIQEMQQTSEALRCKGKTIGFVPTMGYLHEGHLSLVRAARDRADGVVMSIYVNPTQFGPNEDLDKYPRDFERDERLAEAEGVDFLFYPTSREMYPDNYLTYVTVDEITNRLCGASRPGHFRGVTTICTKLFHAVKPHFAVFGQKDYQQSVVIRRMVRDLNLDLDIVVAPIVREPDGLAMSSRNVYLTPDERKNALSLSQALNLAQRMIHGSERDVSTIRLAVSQLIEAKPHTKIDYVEIADPDTLAPLDRIDDQVVILLAVFVGKTRLIDNQIVSV